MLDSSYESQAEEIGIRPSTARQIRERVLEWGEENYRSFPWRESDQGWHGLIAEILLQRTRASNVVQVYNNFVCRFPTPAHLGQSSLEEVKDVIYPLGLVWRAPLLQKLGQQLDALDGNIPLALDELIELPGVGSYVASAWLSFHANVSSTIVDANVVRWLCRIVDRPYDGETRRKKWLVRFAEILTPEERNRDYNFAVLDFTMQICKKNPTCASCPLGAEFCTHGRNTLTAKKCNVIG